MRNIATIIDRPSLASQAPNTRRNKIRKGSPELGPLYRDEAVIIKIRTMASRDRRVIISEFCHKIMARIGKIGSIGKRINSVTLRKVSIARRAFPVFGLQDQRL